jgi:hypothetical protein
MPTKSVDSNVDIRHMTATLQPSLRFEHRREQGSPPLATDDATTSSMVTISLGGTANDV